ncbi:hypothetical protein C8R47DRAFT_393047 [Mycena vitilis]|nr:hypothetical protein C8R47DRAFT_393047 [Mycena vitilis]
MSFLAGHRSPVFCFSAHRALCLLARPHPPSGPLGLFATDRSLFDSLFRLRLPGPHLPLGYSVLLSALRLSFASVSSWYQTAAPCPWMSWFRGYVTVSDTCASRGSAHPPRRPVSPAATRTLYPAQVHPPLVCSRGRFSRPMAAPFFHGAAPQHPARAHRPAYSFTACKALPLRPSRGAGRHSTDSSDTAHRASDRILKSLPPSSAARDHCSLVIAIPCARCSLPLRASVCRRR